MTPQENAEKRREEIERQIGRELRGDVDPHGHTRRLLVDARLALEEKEKELGEMATDRDQFADFYHDEKKSHDDTRLALSEMKEKREELDHGLIKAIADLRHIIYDEHPESQSGMIGSPTEVVLCAIESLKKRSAALSDMKASRKKELRAAWDTSGHTARLSEPWAGSAISYAEYREAWETQEFNRFLKELEGKA